MILDYKVKSCVISTCRASLNLDYFLKKSIMLKTHTDRVYDLHITVNPDGFNPLFVKPPWQIHDIHNVQGAPHLIISQKYTGNFLYRELERMAEVLQTHGALIKRKKIELHFRDCAEARRARNAFGIIEVHYKCKQRGVFPVRKTQIQELNKKKLALSFNMATNRPIISARFSNLETYENGKASDALPVFLGEEEREIVIMDTNNELDSFWPLRTANDCRLVFSEFPQWI